ncbi:MAG: zinc-dependent metalloprotease [Bdellovibrionota bacterium]
MSKNFSLLALSLSLSLVTALGLGCSKKTKEPTDEGHNSTAPIVAGLQTEALSQQPRAVSRMAQAKALRYRDQLKNTRGFRFAGDVAPPAAQPAIQGDVTFTKAEIFDRLFLYGADVQYSSIGEPSMSLLVQSMAVGHIPARFAHVGDRLQLVADQAHLFQSDINHPGRLIHEWPIVRDDATTITVTMRSASPTLVTILKDAKAPVARQTWVRSIQFVAQGNYLLLETSVEQADGTVAEFMESIFPRETLVPAGTPPKVLLADPGMEPLAARYGFIGGEKLFLDLPKGRLQTLVANRFPTPAAGQLIEWYVTPNVPAIYLPILKSGVEGWNRYSQKMWGRDFVRFNGVLPAGVKIGDPRYNVINWDSVPEAGAAYESQASDPLTGLQSHSLVYLPYAWVKIGQDYWKRGGISQEDEVVPALAKVMKRGSLLGEKLKVRCLHDMDLVASLEARTSPEVFARDLLKLVLFHEVGHALGLAHNFKGSLSWNPDDAASVVTTSVMDYNQYQLEGALFTSELGAEGPLAEYDRQVISVLYNEGKDVTATDPVLPACDDDRADDYDGGVDPLCMRYDAGHDPTAQLARTIALLNDETAKLGKTQSLAASIGEIAASLGDPAKAVTEADVTARVSEAANQVLGLTLHYYAAGAQSLAYMAKSNVKMLYDAKAGSLPAPYDSKAMIARSLEGIRYAVESSALEESAEDAITELRAETEAWVKTTAWYGGVANPQKDAGVAKKIEMAFGLAEEITGALVFPKMRSAILKTIVFKDSVPFLFTTETTPALDTEKMMMDLLEQAVTMRMSDGEYRAVEERIVAATSLRSFTPVNGSDAVFTRVATVIGTELAKATSGSERAELRALLKVVETVPVPEKDEEEEE